MRKITQASLLSLAVFTSTTTIALGVDIVHDPINGLGIIEQVIQGGTAISHQVTQITNQAMQIQNQANMLRQNPLKTVVDYQNEANQVASLAQTGQAITYQTQNLSQKFEKRFGEKSDKQSYDDYNGDIIQTELDTSQGTLKSAQEQMKNMKEQSRTIDQIAQSNNHVGGTTAELQGISQMMNAQATQLQSIQQLQAQSNAQQATHYAAQAAKEAQANKADKAWLKFNIKYPKYSDNSKLEVIPTI